MTESSSIASYLLRGWCMLNETCPESPSCPLVRSRDGQTVCVSCRPVCRLYPDPAADTVFVKKNEGQEQMKSRPQPSSANRGNAEGQLKMKETSTTPSERSTPEERPVLVDVVTRSVESEVQRAQAMGSAVVRTLTAEESAALYGMNADDEMDVDKDKVAEMQAEEDAILFEEKRLHGLQSAAAGCKTRMSIDTEAETSIQGVDRFGGQHRVGDVNSPLRRRNDLSTFSRTETDVLLEKRRELMKMYSNLPANDLNMATKILNMVQQICLLLATYGPTEK
ncbi:unnamed protein product [Amoebophrya sp. A25]|nr:unnamed protein product [Amoebophrya sp. A25]|eukprot:GSA25T00010406001.1